MTKPLAALPKTKSYKPGLGANLKLIAKHWMDYLFIAPFFVTFAIFGLYPLLWAMQLSLSRWRGFGPMTFVGLDNYRAIFRDPYVVQALVNTVQFTAILLPTGIFISIFFAVILNDRFLKGRGVFRTIYFLPYITSSVIVAIVFTQLFDDTLGWVNYGLQTLNLPTVGWLRNSAWGAKTVVVLLTHWGGIGYNVLLFLGGLQSIEPEVYEAARIDGANGQQIFWRITLPLLRPIVFFLMIIATIGLMNMFNQPYMLTRGGPQGATETLMLRLYGMGIGQSRFGDASAFGFLVSFLVLGIMVLQMQFRKREAD